MNVFYDPFLHLDDTDLPDPELEHLRLLEDLGLLDEQEGGAWHET